MGNGINKIDEGLFICGASDLSDFELLRRLGITCVLNAAKRDVYTSIELTAGKTLTAIEREFEVKVVGADDSNDCNISVHFQDIADFIEAGRSKGGVVVHCAAGISRATTSCCAYFMIKEHWTLDASFRRVHGVRNIVHPNAGFWRQLLDLEACLQLQGIALRPLPVDWQPMSQPDELQKQEEGEEETVEEVLQHLYHQASAVESYVTQYLTARLTPVDDVSLDTLVSRIKSTAFPGMRVDQVGVSDTEVTLRAGVVPMLEGNGLHDLLSGIPGVRVAVCEHD